MKLKKKSTTGFEYTQIYLFCLYNFILVYLRISHTLLFKFLN